MPLPSVRLLLALCVLPLAACDGRDDAFATTAVLFNAENAATWRVRLYPDRDLASSAASSGTYTFETESPVGTRGGRLDAACDAGVLQIEMRDGTPEGRLYLEGTCDAGLAGGTWGAGTIREREPRGGVVFED